MSPRWLNWQGSILFLQKQHRSSFHSIAAFGTFSKLLQGLQRTGWVKRGVKQPESVASHMYRMAVISMFADSKTGIDRDRQEHWF